jgi:hypothetical protein
MKGTVKALIAGTAIATLAGCSSFETYEQSSVYKVPKWYNDCGQYTTDEWYKLFWAEENLVGCGAATDGFEEHSVSTAIMNAKAKIADRANGVVSSNQNLTYDNGSKDNVLSRTNKITPSNLQYYEIVEKVMYPYQGKFVTFVKIKVPTDQIRVQTSALPN